MWLDGSCLSVRPIDKQQRVYIRNPASDSDPCYNACSRRKNNHLFDIEDKEVLNGADGRQHWAVECADPADGLTVDNL